MPRHARSTAAVALVVVAGLGLAACAAPSGDDADGGTVTFAIEGGNIANGHMNPHRTQLDASAMVLRNVFDSLIAQNQDGSFSPWLAESYEVADDGLSYTFTLRDDVTFSDGSELTAGVVAANFDAIVAMAADGSTASLANQYLAGYEGTTVADAQTFTVDFAAPNAAFLQGASTMSLGIVSQASTEATPESRCQDGVIGTGPFVYDAYSPDAEVSMDKREGYGWASSLREHSGDAHLDRIEFPIITEDSVRTGGLQSGEFDFIGELPYLDEQRFAADFEIYAAPNPGVPTSLIPNLDNPVLADDAVRQALQLGIDREEINETLGFSGGDVPTSALSSGTTGFTSQADAMGYDADAAIAALEAAGWVEGADGVREKDGQRLTFTATGFYEQEMMELIQIQLLEIGVDMQIDFTDAGGFFGAIAERSYDMLFAALTRTDPDALRIMFSQAAPSHWAVVDDAELEQLVTAQAAAADPEERQALLDQAQALIIENGYLFPILEVYQLHASQPDYSGFAFDSASRFHLYDVQAA